MWNSLYRRLQTPDRDPKCINFTTNSTTETECEISIHRNGFPTKKYHGDLSPIFRSYLLSIKDEIYNTIPIPNKQLYDLDVYVYEHKKPKITLSIHAQIDTKHVEQIKEHISTLPEIDIHPNDMIDISLSQAITHNGIRTYSVGVDYQVLEDEASNETENKKLSELPEDIRLRDDENGETYYAKHVQKDYNLDKLHTNGVLDLLPTYIECLQNNPHNKPIYYDIKTFRYRDREPNTCQIKLKLQYPTRVFSSL